MKRAVIAAIVSGFAAISGCAPPSPNTGESAPLAVRITGESFPSRTAPTSVAVVPLDGFFSATIPVDLGPTELAIVPGTSTLFASTTSGEEIVAVDTSTNSVRARYPAAHEADDIAIGAQGDRVYVATGASDHSILVIDTTTGSEVSRIVGLVDRSDSSGHSMVVDRRTGALYVASNGRSGYITKIDLATNAVVWRTRTAEYGYHLALDEEDNAVYVGASTTVLAIDTATGQTTATVHLGTQVSDIEVDRRTRTLYAVNANIKALSVIDLNTDRVATTIAMRYRPSDIALDHSAKLAYVTANSESSAGNKNAEIYVIDTDTNKIIDTYQIADAQLTDVVVDAVTHIAYIGVPNRGVIALLDRAQR